MDFTLAPVGLEILTETGPIVVQADQFLSVTPAGMESALELGVVGPVLVLTPAGLEITAEYGSVSTGLSDTTVVATSRAYVRPMPASLEYIVEVWDG